MKNLSLNSSSIVIDELFECENMDADTQNFIVDKHFSEIMVSVDDISAVSPSIPLITYVAEYMLYTFCSLTQNKMCSDCKDNLTLNKMLAVDPRFNVIHNVDQGGRN